MSTKRRDRPLVNATVAPDVRAALDARAKRLRVPFSHIVESALRVGLGLAPAELVDASAEADQGAK